MSERLNQRNFAAIQDAINKLHKDNEVLKERVQRQDNVIAALQADIANTKQLTAHVMGRGMGSTSGN